MSALRLLVVDDEAHARERIRRLLEKDKDVEIVGECASGTEAVAAVAALKPDLMLLDIQMPELDGFGVVEAIPPHELPVVVFVTAHVEHAVHAFDVHAVDYVLKPVEAARLHAAIARARERLGLDGGSRRAAALAAAGGGASDDERAGAAPLDDDRPPTDRIVVRDKGQLYPIRADEVLYIEADGNYARLFLAKRHFMIRETMANLEQRFDPKQFVRIHRSVIVNLDAIAEIQPWFGGDQVVILKTGTRLKVSRTHRGRLDKWMLG